jgi:alcohol dehydrogenase class IV
VHPAATQRLGDIYGVGMCKGARLPLVQVPTTAGARWTHARRKTRAAQDGEARVGTGNAGTGSEVTPISIITTGTLLPTSNRHHAHAWTRTHRARPL